MPKIRKNQTVKTARANRLRDMLISLLVTPLNLLIIGLRIIWSGRHLRLTGIAILIALTLTPVLRLEILQPAGRFVRLKTHEATAAIGFRVNDITVEGRRRTRRDDLLQAINVAPNTPIFAVNLAAIHARIEGLPWVEEVSVLRRLPNIIHLRLTEREPFAFYREAEKLTLIDRKGVGITGRHLRQFAYLPVFSGPGATLRAASFMDVLVDYPVLRNRMIAAHWTGERRWTLQLDHGGEVHLPAHNIIAALDRLMQLEQDRRILAEENQAIDLRLPDRVLLRPRQKRSSDMLKRTKGAAS